MPTVPRVHGLFPSQPGRTRKQERRAYARSQRFVAGLSLPSAAGLAGHPAARVAPAAPARRLVHVGHRAAREEAQAQVQAVRRRGRARRCARQRYRRPKGAGNAFLFNGPQLGFSIPELFVEFELHSPGAEHARRERGRRAR